MKSNDPSDSGQTENLEPILEEVQDLFTEDLCEADYDVALPCGSEEGEKASAESRAPPRTVPLRARYYAEGGSASSQDLGEDDHDAYAAEYGSPAATRIGERGTEDEATERLRKHHEGRHRSDGQHSTREHYREKKRMRQAICSSLPLTEREKEAVASVADEIDNRPFGHHRALERVILGVVVVVVDERHRQDLPDVDEFVYRTDQFREICRKHDISMSDLSSIKENVREALDSGEVMVGPKRP